MEFGLPVGQVGGESRFSQTIRLPQIINIGNCMADIAQVTIENLVEFRSAIKTMTINFQTGMHISNSI